MKTFRMKIMRDKAKDWREDIQSITEGLRNRGLYPQGYDRDDNYFTISGNYNCDCKHKFDRAYCDNDCSS